ncbi:hypothetical protein [Polyangium fumosum]|uniref:Uncharacterized protein n=1 Tax=Polyangium fumosum TaxID=889272 RepID=A0A4U1J431_9BACT|nr:hypothetical protein [Polyangium fumosum]TKD01798.1 hypothetical protein E8A74_29865 [Polyangium fumosum]
MWEAIVLGPEQGSFMETVRAFAGAMSFVGEGAAAYAEVMQTLVHASSRIAIGFVPYAGPALDLCEAVTGKLLCLPGGKDLSTEERVFSGVGFGFGQITKAWAGIKAAGVKPGAKIVAAGVLSYTDEFLQALQKSRRPWYTGLHGKQLNAAIGKLANQFEGRAGIHLMKQEGRQMLLVGDDVVRDALNIESGLGGGLSKAPDFVTVTKGNKLALSEVKQLENIGANNSGINVNNAVNQLRNGMKALRNMNLASDVERLEVIVPKGAKFAGDYGIKDGYLIEFSSGKTIEIKEGFKNVFIKVVEI